MDKAVALKYDEGQIPQVVARAKNQLCSLLIQKAREFNIPIFQNKELVDMLINIEPISDISEDSYLAVAKILIWLNENEKNAQLS